MKPRLPARLLPPSTAWTAAFALALSAALPMHSAHAQQKPDLDVPYVPTPQEVVDKMVDMAKVKKGDVVYDLGCGDGRIVITAVQRGAGQGVCVDMNPERIAEARANAKEAGVADKIKFVEGDLFKTDLSQADVVTLYLLPSVNRKLRPQLWEQLEPGTRVVSHAFDMGQEWPPEQTEKVDHRTIYSWTVTEDNKKAASTGS